jgi:hypothetical protein
MGNKVKEHYEQHLADFYSWMIGDFEVKQKEQEDYFSSHSLQPRFNRLAVDLGAGHGLQSISLAKLGFSVFAIDFNEQLLNELRFKAKGLDLLIINKDINDVSLFNKNHPEMVVCMGDTITHLASLEKVTELIYNVSKQLLNKGKFVVSFRDLTSELIGSSRFIPVKSDEHRILTCFLEYFPEFVMVTDLLHENRNGQWVQKVSSYPKLRISAHAIEQIIERADMRVICSETINRMVHIIAEKQ